MRRRTFVASAVTVGAVAVAGCTETGTGDGTETGTTTTGGTTTEETTTEATTTPTPAPTPAFAEEPVVTVAEYAFSPQVLRVRPGTKVTWRNEGNDTHTVQSDVFNPDVATEWSFYSADLARGGSTSYTFEESGVYEYYCTAHGRTRMCGVVLVGNVEYSATLPCEG